MNILLLYPKEVPWTIGRYLERSLRKKQYVEVFDLLQEQSYLHYYNIAMQRRFYNIGKIKFNIPSVKGTFSRRTTNILSIMKKCRKQPDLIIEIDGGGYHHLEGFKNVDIPKIYWAINSHESYKLKFQKKIAPDFNYIFVAQKDYVSSFKNIKEKVYWLPMAADHEIHKTYNYPKVFDIGFVGSKKPKKYADRIKVLNRLSKRYNVLFIEGIWGKNMSKIYNISKIGFNKSLSGDLTPRVFEIMSIGTMLLTEAGSGINKLFKDKEHLVIYKSEDELDELIDYYLKNEEERENIAKKGQREVHKYHTYDNRVQYMFEKIGF